MAVPETTIAYLSSFEALEKRANGAHGSWLPDLRREAIGRFSALGFPTTKQEEWKYTNVSPLSRVVFRPAARDAADRLTPDQLARLKATAVREPAGSLLVFVNGRYSRNLSSVGALPEHTTIGSLAEALDKSPDRVQPHLASLADFSNHAFAALNTAFVEDGAFVHVPAGHCLIQPIHVIHASTGDEPTVSYPRTLVIVGESGHVTLVETYVGLSAETTYFTNAVTEIALAANAAVEHYKLQAENAKTFHVAVTQVRQGPMSHYTSHSFSAGGALVRNDLRSLLDGEGADCTLNGLYVVDGKQHVDNHTTIDHAKPSCRSEELYKGVLNGQGSAVFNGRIIVRPDSQKTDANQTNRNLLLSEGARVDTKPQLEILANDVKCTHGAAVGALDEEALFYLRARGMDREAASQLLTYAFAGELLARVRPKLLRAEAERLVLAHLPGSERFAGAI
jgi:Fe-S cluster assembly protein SufD